MIDWPGPALLYPIGGVFLFVLGLYAVVVRRHLIQKVLALNVMGSGVFMVLLSVAVRGSAPDPVAQALTLTGIVVAASATAFALALVVCLKRVTGAAELDVRAGRDDDGTRGP